MKKQFLISLVATSLLVLAGCSGSNANSSSNSSSSSSTSESSSSSSESSSSESSSTSETHHFSSEWSSDGDYHWHACLDAGCTEVADKAAHTFGDWIIDSAATCTSDGEEHKICSVCGKKISSSISATGHNYILKDSAIEIVKAPTASVAGEVRVHCSNALARGDNSEYKSVALDVLTSSSVSSNYYSSSLATDSCNLVLSLTKSRFNTLFVAQGFTSEQCNAYFDSARTTSFAWKSDIVQHDYTLRDEIVEIKTAPTTAAAGELRVYCANALARGDNSEYKSVALDILTTSNVAAGYYTSSKVSGSCLLHMTLSKSRFATLLSAQGFTTSECDEYYDSASRNVSFEWVSSVLDHDWAGSNAALTTTPTVSATGLVTFTCTHSSDATFKIVMPVLSNSNYTVSTNSSGYLVYTMSVVKRVALIKAAMEAIGEYENLANTQAIANAMPTATYTFTSASKDSLDYANATLTTTPTFSSTGVLKVPYKNITTNYRTLNLPKLSITTQANYSCAVVATDSLKIFMYDDTLSSLMAAQWSSDLPSDYVSGASTIYDNNLVSFSYDNSTITATASYGQNLIQASTSPETDWFEYDCTAGGTVTVTVTNTGDANVNKYIVALYNSNGTMSSGTTTASITAQTSLVYIKIYCAQSVTDSNVPWFVIS